MRWFRKSVLLFTLLALGAGSAPAARKDDSTPDPAKAAKADKKKKDKKQDAAAAGADKKADPADPEKGAARLSVPIPPGHDAKKLVIPYRDEKGDLQTRFTMDLGKRTDLDHMEMTKLLIETFDSGNPEMTIDLPQSVLNLNTRIITTKSGVLIKRADFELHGETMEFNTESKQGRLGGKVRMLIYNLDNETNSDSPTPPRGP